MTVNRERDVATTPAYPELYSEELSGCMDRFQYFSVGNQPLGMNTTVSTSWFPPMRGFGCLK